MSDNHKINGDKTLPSDDTDNGTGRVTFTIKEILADISKKIDVVTTKLDNKIDRSEYDLAHEALVSKVAVVETKLATTEALKIQADRVGEIYLKQFEQMQREITDLNAVSAVAAAVAKDKDNWKVLWIPIMANVVISLGYIYVSWVK